jgi:hypothetical protein
LVDGKEKMRFAMVDHKDHLYLLKDHVSALSTNIYIVCNLKSKPIE